MLVVFAVLALIVVFVIAAVAVGRESGRLSAEAPRPVFDLDEAVTWVADRVPFEVSAVLSHDDVRRILRWNLADLQAAAAEAEPLAAPAGGADPGDAHAPAEAALPPSPLTVMGEDEALASVRDRAAREGLAYTEAEVRSVLGAHLAYLEVIGAVGPAELTESSAGLHSAGGDGGEGDTMSAPEKGGGPAEQTM
ncbi:MAG: hypothetical protein M3P97_04035 [Actinomycetota bacterium]|nr:hypothetical protein [Actinomycetota bacterium]